MTTDNRTIASGTLDENGDTFFLKQPNHFLLLDAPFTIDLKMIGHAVSAIGHIGIPDSAPGITKLILDKIVLQDAIAVRAFEIFESPLHVSRRLRAFTASGG